MALNLCKVTKDIRNIALILLFLYKIRDCYLGIGNNLSFILYIQLLYFPLGLLYQPLSLLAFCAQFRKNG